MRTPDFANALKVLQHRRLGHPTLFEMIQKKKTEITMHIASKARSVMSF